MLFRDGDRDTICALSTAPGVGGIAVIRVSGEGSLRLTRKTCSFLPTSPESHRIYFGTLKTSEENEALDEVLVSFFQDGRSFTGEETCEISCHGGGVVSTSILKELVKLGCRLARPGEFTFRAFMNGRLDLVQAEGVLGLIESQSRQAAKASLRQLKGHLSHEFERIEDDLVWILAQLEANIDFSSEISVDIESKVGQQSGDLLPTKQMFERASRLNELVVLMIRNYESGRVLREGLQVALVGRPNAGKSSLLNAFLREDRAIVTAEAGTTRDTIEGKLTFGGVPVTLVDTAGLRETQNEIEILGIQRSRLAMKNSDLVFNIIDLSSDDWLIEFNNLLVDSDINHHFIFNKVDLNLPPDRRVLSERAVSEAGVNAFWLSALTRVGLASVESMLEKRIQTLSAETSNVVVQARHLEQLCKIQNCLTAAIDLIKSESSPEFIAFELQEAVHVIHELLGKEFNEQVIDRIFSEFCLGK
jgi:tRNA modification GTPase